MSAISLLNFEQDNKDTFPIYLPVSANLNLTATWSSPLLVRRIQPVVEQFEERLGNIA